MHYGKDVGDKDDFALVTSMSFLTDMPQTSLICASFRDPLTCKQEVAPLKGGFSEMTA